MKRSVLYICYYNITEPLVQTQVVSYLRELASRGREIHLLTFEREKFSRQQRDAIANSLGEAGIRWHALRYHRRPSLPATLYDIVAGTLFALRLCRKHDVSLVHARSHVPAAMALMLKRITGCGFLFDVRGLLADEYVDAGHWSAGDIKFRLTKGMERVFFKRADAFVVLTNRLKQQLLNDEPVMRDRSADIQVIPCCVDVDKFAVTPDETAAYRRQRTWETRIVLTYVGKLSPWYFPEEMVKFFSAAKRRDARFFFQILTQSDAGAIERALESAGMSSADYDARFVPQDSLPLILSASDVSISFRKGRRSTPAVSPTKVGESLAAGVPVVTNAGVGDCDSILGDQRLGIIVNEFSDAGYERAIDALLELLSDEDIARRCRLFAEQGLSLKTVGGPRYAAVYERLLGVPVVTHASRASEVAAR